ncbi:hypothetical protein [Gilvibacter sediminis]|uniref:hypothetical protein n=1 Tax=Gilvibacter sediminis TaxID=379071 RepID=UPI00235034EC|nr:hypothetical protein [Gilvibacter sediminis]MDC7996903.1 hypothetical protein [Gilvibacter sediminis]
MGWFKKKKGEVYYSLEEDLDNVVIKRLITLIKACSLIRNPKDINRTECVCRDSSILICHAYKNATTGKQRFIDNRINSPRWWRSFMPETNDEIVYLFSCKGYYAVYWNIFNFYTPNMVSYNSELGFSIQHPLISRFIKEYFCAVAQNISSKYDLVGLRNSIVTEKNAMIDKIKEAMIEADKRNDQMDLLTLKYQLVCGFQNNGYSIVLINKRKKWNL